MKRRRRYILLFVLAIVFVGVFAGPVFPQAGPGFVLPKITFGIDQAQRPGEVAVALQVLRMAHHG